MGKSKKEIEIKIGLIGQPDGCFLVGRRIEIVVK